MDLFYKELREEIKQGTLSSIYTDEAENQRLAAFRENIENDYKFLDALYQMIGSEQYNQEQRKDIITSRFFIGAYSRLRQLRDSIALNYDIPEGYARRIVENTEYIIGILGRIKDAPHYGLTNSQVDFMIFKLQKAKDDIEKKIPKPETDKAMAIRKGGIDLTPANMNLQIQNEGGEIKFHLDPAMLQQLQNAPGFVPVIISVQPMTSLRKFLGC